MRNKKGTVRLLDTSGRNEIVAVVRRKAKSEMVGRRDQWQIVRHLSLQNGFEKENSK